MKTRSTLSYAAYAVSLFACFDFPNESTKGTQQKATFSSPTLGFGRVDLSHAIAVGATAVIAVRQSGTVARVSSSDTSVMTFALGGEFLSLSPNDGEIGITAVALREGRAELTLWDAADKVIDTVFVDAEPAARFELSASRGERVFEDAPKYLAIKAFDAEGNELLGRGGFTIEHGDDLTHELHSFPLYENLLVLKGSAGAHAFSIHAEQTTQELAVSFVAASDLTEVKVANEASCPKDFCPLDLMAYVNESEVEGVRCDWEKDARLTITLHEALPPRKDALVPSRDYYEISGPAGTYDVLCRVPNGPEHAARIILVDPRN